MVALFESAGSGCSAYRGDVAFPFCPDMAGELSSLGGIRCARPGRMDDQDRREIVGGGNAQRCFILRDDPPLIPAPTCDLHRSFGACPDRAEISPFGLQLPIGGGASCSRVFRALAILDTGGGRGSLRTARPRRGGLRLRDCARGTCLSPHPWDPAVNFFPRVH